MNTPKFDVLQFSPDPTRQSMPLDCTVTTTDTGRLSFTVHLPWPPRACSPNARHGHWAVKRKADTRYRRTAEVATLRVTGGPLCCEYVLLHVQFCPPDRRRRDRDNCIAAFKGAQDGIADAIGIDDSKFAVSYAEMGEPVRGGAVLVTITEVWA